MSHRNAPFVSTSFQDNIYKDQLEHGYMAPENNAAWQSLPNLPAANDLSTPNIPIFRPIPSQWNSMNTHDPSLIPMCGIQDFMSQRNQIWHNPMDNEYAAQPEQPMMNTWPTHVPNEFLGHYDMDVDMEEPPSSSVSSSTPVRLVAPSPPPPPVQQPLVSPPVATPCAMAVVPRPQKKRYIQSGSSVSSSSSVSSCASSPRVCTTKRVSRNVTVAKKKARSKTSLSSSDRTTSVGGLEADHEAFVERCRNVARSKIAFVLHMFDLDKGLEKNPQFEELERRLYQYARVDPDNDGSLPDAWNDVWQKCTKLHSRAAAKKKRRQYVDQHQAQIHWRMSAYFVRAVAYTSRFRHPITRRIDEMNRISFVLTMGFNGGCTPTLLIPVNTWKKKEFREEIREFFQVEPPKQWGTFDVAKDAFLESSRLLVDLEKSVLGEDGGDNRVMEDGFMDADAVITNQFDMSDL